MKNEEKVDTPIDDGKKATTWEHDPNEPVEEKDSESEEESEESATLE